ncbi:hypothetical protein [Piscirickettsia litoralis]|uniref:hypothetical protein n=1 Tax=Piscirickettsia litoralis TaxID=1891921 RepID=UPI0013018BFC|nr:hypothetical protein [Piscirickettsia litoralis]
MSNELAFKKIDRAKPAVENVVLKAIGKGKKLVQLSITKDGLLELNAFFAPAKC